MTPPNQGSDAVRDRFDPSIGIPNKPSALVIALEDSQLRQLAKYVSEYLRNCPTETGEQHGNEAPQDDNS